MLILSFLSFYYFSSHNLKQLDPLRFVYYGLPCFLFFIGYYMFPVRLSVLGFVGNISYSLYLCHLSFSFQFYNKFINFLGLNFSSIFNLVLLLMFSILCAFVSYLYIEKPVMNFFKSKRQYV